ncbi:MAG: pseudouridylate synthase [Bacteroidales bacterium]|jgi:predicted hotdog family 3-hydroxylacyl-ACP dehydratase|nr:pseudouridylate synthase [Bacteroidales bacterium]
MSQISNLKSQISIQDTLPQKPPFVMVDTLLYCDTKTIKTALTVLEDNIFVENGVLAEAGLMENIAQTCAARVGNADNLDNETGNHSVKIGFIGMIRNLEILRLPKVGETVITKVDWMEEVFRISLVNATVKIEDKIIATCEMKISVTEKEI